MSEPKPPRLVAWTRLLTERPPYLLFGLSFVLPGVLRPVSGWIDRQPGGGEHRFVFGAAGLLVLALVLTALWRWRPGADAIDLPLEAVRPVRRAVAEGTQIEDPALAPAVIELARAQRHPWHWTQTAWLSPLVLVGVIAVASTYRLSTTLFGGLLVVLAVVIIATDRSRAAQANHRAAEAERMAEAQIARAERRAAGLPLETL